MDGFDLRRFRAGDTAFYRHLHDSCQGYLMSITLSFGQDAAWAEDRYQETWVAIWEKRRTLRRGRSFTAWAGRIARNLCLSALRAQRREAERTTGLEDMPPDAEFAADEDDLLARTERRQFRERVLEELERLPRAQREAFHLVHLEEHSAQEAAEILGTQASTVRSNVRHAARRLASRLEEFKP